MAAMVVGKEPRSCQSIKMKVPKKDRLGIKNSIY